MPFLPTTTSSFSLLKKAGAAAAAASNEIVEEKILGFIWWHFLLFIVTILLFTLTFCCVIWCTLRQAHSLYAGEMPSKIISEIPANKRKASLRVKLLSRTPINNSIQGHHIHRHQIPTQKKRPYYWDTSMQENNFDSKRRPYPSALVD